MDARLNNGYGSDIQETKINKPQPPILFVSSQLEQALMTELTEEQATQNLHQ